MNAPAPVRKWSQTTIGSAPERVRAAVTKRFKAPHLAQITIKTYDPSAEMIIEAMANAAIEDRSEEIMPKECWDLENFLKNPVLLTSHNQWDALAVIGGVTKVEPTDEGLRITASLGNPAAGHPLTSAQNEHRSLVAQKYLKALSVGFIAHEWEYNEETDTLTYKRAELLEVSLVAIPCQQDSLIETVKRNDPSQRAPKPAAKSAKTKGTEAMDEELKGRLDAQDAALKAIQEECAAIKTACEALKPKAEDAPPPAAGETEEGKALKKEIERLKAENVELCAALEASNEAMKVA